MKKKILLIIPIFLLFNGCASLNLTDFVPSSNQQEIRQRGVSFQLLGIRVEGPNYEPGDGSDFDYQAPTHDTRGFIEGVQTNTLEIDPIEQDRARGFPGRRDQRYPLDKFQNHAILRHDKKDIFKHNR